MIFTINPNLLSEYDQPANKFSFQFFQLKGKLNLFFLFDCFRNYLINNWSWSREAGHSFKIYNVESLKGNIHTPIMLIITSTGFLDFLISNDLIQVLASFGRNAENNLTSQFYLKITIYVKLFITIGTENGQKPQKTDDKEFSHFFYLYIPF